MKPKPEPEARRVTQPDIEAVPDLIAALGDEMGELRLRLLRAEQDSERYFEALRQIAQEIRADDAHSMRTLAQTLTSGTKEKR
jgi:AAA+ ATPase superfamily predicted ATPase